VDPGEAALRECLEETGYRARRAEPLGVVSPNPALFANVLHGYFATDVEPEGAVQNTGSEVTAPVLVPLHDLPRMLVSGEIDHALVAQTLWRYLYLYGPR
jgi:8-oxo-dGTP pyrophosphatase MutT (NUDIX family)